MGVGKVEIKRVQEVTDENLYIEEIRINGRSCYMNES